MKKDYPTYLKSLFTLLFLITSFLGFAQAVSGTHFTVSLANPTSTVSTFEVDMQLIVDPTGTALADGGSKVSAIAVGLNFNSAILNGGTPSTVNDAGVWTFIPGTRSPELSGLQFAQDGTYYRNVTISGTSYAQCRIIGSYQGAATSVQLAPGTYTIGRYRFTNTVAFTPDGDPQLWLQPSTLPAGSANTIVTAYKYDGTGSIFSYTTTSSTVGVSLAYTMASPMSGFRVNLANTQFQTALDVVAAPNPFNDSFKLNFDSKNQSLVKVAVYDMMGRKIETMEANATLMATQPIGQSYASGVYNMVVTSGDKVKTVRVIKR